MYNYSIVRTNRKNMAVVVTRENRIEVRCSKSVSLDKIERFVEANDAWIKRHLERNQLVLDKMQSFYDFKSVYILGEQYPLQISDRNFFDGSCLFVKDRKYINKTLVKQFGERRLARVRELALMMNAEVSGLSFRKYSSRWGCCNRSKAIVFSYATLMLNDYLFDYIAVHELCHIFYMDHSKFFKAKLASFLPDWTKRKKALKEYSFLLSIY